MLIRRKRQITKEQYERAQEHGGSVTPEDELVVFSEAERIGYGVYDTSVYKETDPNTNETTYYVSYSTGSHCD